MKTRDAYYDNAKFLLIFFVVFGHLIQSYAHGNQLYYSVYATIYTFHMPGFILISGFFAKGFHKPGYLKKITKKLIIPYFMFQGIYTVYYYFLLEKEVFVFNPFKPQWSLWFLLSLFCWNIMLFLFTKWKASIALVVSVALGIFVGYFDEINSFLSLSRTFVFFPFFLLGYYLKKEHFEKLQEHKFKYISLLILISIFVTIYFLPNFEHRWLFGSKPYGVLIDSEIYGGIIRLGVYCLTLLATFSIFALVPRQNYFFTKWGVTSIYVYLLHGFFIRYFRVSELKGIIGDYVPIVILFILSTLLVAFLSTGAVRKMTQFFVEFKFPANKKITLESSSEQMKN